MRYLFEDYTLDTHLYELRQGGEPLKIEPKVFSVLAYLVAHRESVVSKDDLFDKVWPGQLGSEAALNSCIMMARKAVGDTGRKKRVIQTISGRGYRFIADVIGEELLPPSPPPFPSPTTRCCMACQHPNSIDAAFCARCGVPLVQLCPQCQHRVPLPADFCPACGQRLEEETPRHQPGRFVGRQEELHTLHACLAQAAGGQGQVVGIVGVPGVGKSWLLNEFRRQAQDKSITYVEGRCLPYGRFMPYHILRDLLRQLCGITRAATAEAITTHISRHLHAIGMDVTAHMPLMLQVLDVATAPSPLAGRSPATLRVQTFAVLRQVFLASSRVQPVILAIEDAHWLDHTSETWLTSLVADIPHVPLLLLSTATPEAPPAWMAQPYATALPLPPLVPEDALRLVHGILPQTEMSAPLAQVILSKAAGHPLLLSELTRAIAEQRDFGATVAVPDTIRGVLLGRIERLPEAPQRLLQIASVLGRVFPRHLLQALWDGMDNPEAALLELERRALCYEQHGAEESVYVCKHALIQEVVYKRLSTAQRRRWHAAAGQALERRYADGSQEMCTLLAYHYTAAQQADKAMAYWTRCAEYATTCYAHVEAVMALQEALQHVDNLPAEERDRRQLDLVLRHAQALVEQGHSQDATALLLHQQERLAQLQDAQQSSRYALLLSHITSQDGAWEQAVPYAQQAIEAAAACQDYSTMAQAYQVLATERYWAGRPLEGIAYGEQAVTLRAPTAEGFQLGRAHFVLGLNALLLGNFDQALQAEAQAQALGDTLGEPQLQALAAWATGWIETTRGDWEAGITACQRALACAPDPLNAALALGWLGYAHLEQGDVDKARPLLEQAIEQIRQFDYQRLRGVYTTLLSEAALACGEVNKARSLARQGVAIAAATQDHAGMGQAYRTLGHIAKVSGALAEAGQYLHQALATFTAMPARFEMGRTHLALTELAHHRGRTDDSAGIDPR